MDTTLFVKTLAAVFALFLLWKGTSRGGSFLYVVIGIGILYYLCFGAHLPTLPR